MKNKKWVSIWIGVFPIIISLVIFNYLVDPLATNRNKILKTQKIIETNRDEKVFMTKHLEKIDTLVLGSSRSMLLDPDYISQFLPGYGFNFSVNSALPEDYYGSLKYLERNNKIIKNLIIGIDFFVFNKRIPPDRRFLANQELNFLKGDSNSTTNFIKDYINSDILILSFKTLYYHFFVYRENDLNLEKKFQGSDSRNGLLLPRENESRDMTSKTQEELDKDFDNYFRNRYLGYSYEAISQKRIEYLDAIIRFVKQYDINLYVFLTPVHCTHLSRIKEDEVLANTLIEVKRLLAKKIEYVDFMIENDKNCKGENFLDSVHMKRNLSNLMVESLFLETPAYGERVKKVEDSQ